MTKGNGLARSGGKCATCEFSHDLKRPGLVDLQCRRLPPVPLVTGMQLNSLTNTQTAMVSQCVPMVAKDFWCGEYQPRMSDVVPILRPRPITEAIELIPPKEEQ